MLRYRALPDVCQKGTAVNLRQRLLDVMVLGGAPFGPNRFLLRQDVAIPVLGQFVHFIRKYSE
jgi:hypothetical protein